MIKRQYVVAVGISFLGLSLLFLLTSENSSRLPQGTLISDENQEIQEQLDRLDANEVATITIGEEHATLLVLKDFSSTDNIAGVGGGDICKAYKLTTKDGTEEVGVMCRTSLFDSKWEHRPWRDWFKRLG